MERLPRNISRRRFLTAGVTASAAFLFGCNAQSTPEPTSRPISEPPKPTPTIKEVTSEERLYWYHLLADWKLGNGKTVLEQFPYMRESLGVMAGTLGLDKFSSVKNQQLKVYRSSEVFNVQTKYTAGFSNKQFQVVDRAGAVLKKEDYISSLTTEVYFPLDPADPKLDAIALAMVAHTLARQQSFAMGYVNVISQNEWDYKVSEDGLVFKKYSPPDLYPIMQSIALGYGRNFRKDTVIYSFEDYLRSAGFYSLGAVLVYNWLIQDPRTDRRLYNHLVMPHQKSIIDAQRTFVDRLVVVDDNTATWHPNFRY